MENKGKMNITRHAIIRYAQRIYKNEIITDRTYDQWRGNHEEEVAQIEAKIKEEYAAAEYITTAAYDKHRKAEFYINEEKMMTYVIAENSVVTCYKVDYDLDIEGNKVVYKGFKESLQRALRAEEELEETSKEDIKKIADEIKIRNMEIEELDTKIARLKAEKKQLEAQLEEISAKKREIKVKIFNIREKIVRSKKAL